MFHQRCIKIGDIRYRQFEHHLTAIRKRVEFLNQLREQDRFGAGLVRALDRDLRFDDRYEAVLGNPRCHVKLLRHHRGDTLF